MDPLVPWSTIGDVVKNDDRQPFAFWHIVPSGSYESICGLPSWLAAKLSDSSLHVDATETSVFKKNYS